jgi:hypothetical protein
MTSINRHSTPAMPTSIANLEKRLATDMTLDIFTMEPKVRPFAWYHGDVSLIVLR